MRDREGNWIDERSASERGDGAAAGENMGLGVLSEINARMTALEESNAAMRAQLDKAHHDGDVNFDFAHANHVLAKHFFHDRPEVDDASKLGSG